MHDYDDILDNMLLADLDNNQAVPAPAPVPVKKHFTAAEVAQFLMERKAKDLPPLDRMPWVVKQVGRGAKFPGCGADGCHLGVFVGLKYVRTCHRCLGKGHLNDKDVARHYTWSQAKKAGVSKVSYKAHNHTNMYAPLG